MVGVIGLELNRAEFYEKELTFQVSCSYGPGRYDEAYEERGTDYPLPFVRWTEKRNFEAVLDALSSGALKTQPLITERVPLADFNQIYGALSTSKSIASILKYPERPAGPLNHSVLIADRAFTNQKGVIGVIGAGNFTKMTMLPALRKTNAHFKTIASANGLTGTILAKKYGFKMSTTNMRDILSDSEIDLVMITTRHNLHAPQLIQCLEAGKHVFVEKPLAINQYQLHQIIEAYATYGSITLTVGFNRRFSPHSVAVKKNLGNGPMNIIATMNAGFIPANSWVHSRDIGGGRIIGEACHLIDLCSYFTGSSVVEVCANSLGNTAADITDNSSILLKYADGSNAVINYFANGNKTYPKERIEVYTQERTAVIDNFQVTKGYGFKGFSSLKTSLDKGHKHQFAELINRIKNGGSPLISFESLVNTTKASFAVIESLQQHKWIKLE